MAEQTLSSTVERELTDTRIINAPRELVWRVWTEPVHVTQWWGPNGFTNTTSKMDVRPGGEWTHVMHGPDGRDYKNEIVYVEVVKPERLVYDHVNHPLFRATVTFEDVDGKTKMTMRMVFETAEEKRKVVEIFKADVGQKETLRRLEDYLEKL
jgi:uncharacterized protein YndB with AHSA1/START domain